MKNTTLLIGIVLLVALVGGFIFVGSARGGNSINGNVVSDNSVSAGNVQKVILGMKNYNYNPNTITVKAGQPVSITLDSSVQGCLRSFAIKDLGVSKYAKTPSETIDFTPTKKGTFTFACSMGMGYGTLVVE